MAEQDAGDARFAALCRWVFEDLGFAGSQIAPASADASFRRYFRLTRGADSFIIMDAPPDKESLRPFLRVADLLAGVGVNVPLVLARNLTQGFLLLSDLGSQPYLNVLNDGNADQLYGDALEVLCDMQLGAGATSQGLPPYDAALLNREMELMPEWFFGRHLSLQLSGAENLMIERLFASLTESALAQPQCFVHRDYHSRNLMVTNRNNPGILDFQDAVHGPLTYDLVSLLKDCYIEWPAERVRQWALGFRDRLVAAGMACGTGPPEFIQWFDLMGLQRHIKVLGIFSRLFYRDGKSQYLLDLPLVLRYAATAAGQYAETAEFAAFLTARVCPQFDAVQRRAVS